MLFFIEYSHIHPNKLTKDDLAVAHLRCFASDFKKLNKTMAVINAKIKLLRSNKDFWDKVLSNFSKDFNLPFISASDYYYMKGSFKYKKELDRGDFDVFN